MVVQKGPFRVLLCAGWGCTHLALGSIALVTLHSLKSVDSISVPGVSYTFGSGIVETFCQKHNLDLICRAHQVVEASHLSLSLQSCGPATDPKTPQSQKYKKSKKTKKYERKNQGKSSHLIPKIRKIPILGPFCIFSVFFRTFGGQLGVGGFFFFDFFDFFGFLGLRGFWAL